MGYAVLIPEDIVAAAASGAAFAAAKLNACPEEASEAVRHAVLMLQRYVATTLRHGGGQTGPKVTSNGVTRWSSRSNKRTCENFDISVPCDVDKYCDGNALLDTTAESIDTVWAVPF